MADLNRKEEQLTTADLAGRTEEQNISPDIRDRDDPNRLRLVRNDNLHNRQDTGDRTSAGSAHNIATDAASPLFSESDVGDLRGRWSNVQAGFVDEPRHAVEEADKLVATVMQRLAEGFANERSNLEKQWDSGDNVSTEDLRLALQRYRSFFDRLLNA